MAAIFSRGRWVKQRLAYAHYTLPWPSGFNIRKTYHKTSLSLKPTRLIIAVISWWAPQRLKLPASGIVYSTVCSGTDQRKHQSSMSSAFVRGIHQSPVSWKMFPFDDIIMITKTSGRWLDSIAAETSAKFRSHWKTTSTSFKTIWEISIQLLMLYWHVPLTSKLDNSPSTDNTTGVLLVWFGNKVMWWLGTVR